MRRFMTLCLIVTVAYFSYPFMQPAFSVDEQAPEVAQERQDRTEFMRLARASAKLRRETSPASMNLPDPSPEILFVATP
jgi:cell division protein FtsB